MSIPRKVKSPQQQKSDEAACYTWAVQQTGFDPAKAPPLPTTVRAIKAGAVDFLTKPVATDTLLESLAIALERDAENSRQRSRAASLAGRYATLTARERQVMAGVIAGLLNKQIAYALDTAERTVKTHRSRVMAKMGVRRVPDLVHVADQLRAAGIALAPTPSDGPKDALRTAVRTGQ